MKLVAALAAAATLAVAAPAAWASEQHPTLPEIEGDYMCLLCKTPLDESSSPFANQERAVIRRLIARGLTKSQIKDELVKDYGSGIPRHRRTAVSTSSRGGCRSSEWC